MRPLDYFINDLRLGVEEDYTFDVCPRCNHDKVTKYIEYPIPCRCDQCGFEWLIYKVVYFPR